MRQFEIYLKHYTEKGSEHNIYRRIDSKMVKIIKELIVNYNQGIQPSDLEIFNILEEDLEPVHISLFGSNKNSKVSKKK